MLTALRTGPEPQAIPRPGAEARYGAATAARSSAVESFRVIDGILDLSRGGRDVDGLLSLPPGERAGALRTAATLIQRGIVGFEWLDVQGRDYQSFATTRIADPRLRAASLSERNPRPRRRLDIHA